MAERIVMARTGLTDLMALLRKEHIFLSAFSPLSHPRLAERISAGQPSGTSMPSGTPVPSGIPVPSGAAIPSGTPISSGTPFPSGASIPIDPILMEFFKESLPALANPDMKFILRTGGGSSPMAEETVCLAKDRKPIGLIVEGMEALVVQYADAGAVADGFLGLHASRTQAVSPNLIPPLTDTGEFLCLLNAIDMYRRSYYASMLSCLPQTEPGVAAEVFLKDMSRVLEARDVRWLLGAFIALMPNFPIVRDNPDPVRVILDAGLCRMMKDKAGKPWLQFTDAGKALGVEFERTWLTSAGYSLAGISGNREFTVGSGFIAPTAVTNHVMTLKMENGKLRINHQAFYTDQVKTLWMDLFDAGWKLVNAGGPPLEVKPAETVNPQYFQPTARPATQHAPQSATQPVARPATQPTAQPATWPAAQTAPTSRFCAFCGKPLAANNRFCDSCGKPVS